MYHWVLQIEFAICIIFTECHQILYFHVPASNHFQSPFPINASILPVFFHME